MNAVKASLWKQLGWKSLAELLTRLLSMGYFFLLARVLGETQFGLYAWPLAFAGFVGVILDPGMHSLLIRNVAREPDKSQIHLQAVLLIRCLASLVFLLLCMAFLPFQQGFQSIAQNSLYLLAAGCLLIGQSWLDTWVAWLNAHQDFKQETRIRLGMKLFVLLPPMICLLIKPEIHALLWAAALPQFICWPLFLWQIRSYLQPWQIKLRDLKPYFKQGIGFWIANISWMLYLKLDLVMLPLLGRSAQELGWYQIAIRYYEIVCLGGYLLSMTAFPRLSAKADQTDAFQTESSKLLKLALVLGIGTAAAAFALSSALPWALGQNYLAVVHISKILCLSIPMVYMNMLMFNIFGAQDRQNLTAWATSLCFVCNGLCNLYAIPRWGIQGAAFSTLIADVFLCGVLVALLRTLRPQKA